MLSAILHSPLVFFETTPMGRVMNRFSRDIETVDKILPELFESWMISAFNVLATVIILCYAVPWFVIVAVPLAVIYYFAQVIYLTASSADFTGYYILMLCQVVMFVCLASYWAAVTCS